IVAVNEPESSMPSRLTVENPVSVNVTAYVPARRSTIRYWPEPSVTAERVFSISTGLETSTVTPGSTAPDVSLTTPVTDARTPWAETADGDNATAAAANMSTSSLTTPRIERPPLQKLSMG